MRARNNGFALVIVLVTTAGIFALATQAGVSSRAAIVESRVALERASALRGARAAAGLVLRGLIRTGHERSAAGSRFGTQPTGGHGARESKPSIELPAIIKELLGSFSDEVEDGARRAPGRGSTANVFQASGAVPYIPDRWLEVVFPHDQRMYRVRLSDANGQLNINHVEDKQFRHFLALKGIGPADAASIADQLLDWIDEDHFVRMRGAEDERHRSQGVVCANRPMRVRRELLYLPTMTNEIFRRIRDELSVGGDGKLHVGTASREALMTLDGMNSEIVGRIIARRRIGLITPEELDDLLPLAAREAREQMRLASGPVLRVRVDVFGPGNANGLEFEGLAVVGSSGEVRTLHLRDRLPGAAQRTEQD